MRASPFGKFTARQRARALLALATSGTQEGDASYSPTASTGGGTFMIYGGILTTYGQNGKSFIFISRFSCLFQE